MERRRAFCGDDGAVLVDSASVTMGAWFVFFVEAETGMGMGTGTLSGRPLAFLMSSPLTCVASLTLTPAERRGGCWGLCSLDAFWPILSSSRSSVEWQRGERRFQVRCMYKM